MFLGAINILLGAFFLWMGAFQLITAMLPHDFAVTVAEKHGAWWRENIFHLPPTTQQPKDTEC